MVTTILEDYEYEFLLKCNDREPIPKEQDSLRSTMAQQGIIKYLSNSLTYYGKQVLELDRVERSPLRRTLHSFLMPFI